MWTVQDRYGWGWSVYDPKGQGGMITPLDRADACRVYCDVRNAGGTHDEAWKAAKAAGGKTRNEV